MSFGDLLSRIVDGMNRILNWRNLKLVSIDSVPGYHRFRVLPPIATVIDVGVGHEGSPFLYQSFPDAFFISIDPLRECQKAVERHLPMERSVFVETALGSEESSITIGVASMPSMTSILQRKNDDELSQAIEMREVPVRCLDEVIETVMDGRLIERPVFLKVDTEGYEMEVLKGAEKTLQLADYVMLETPLAEHVQGSYSLEEAVAFMDSQGFSVFQIIDAAVDLVDLLYVRKDDPIRETYVYGRRKGA